MLTSEHFSNRVRINNSRSEWILNPNHYSRFDGILPLTNINEMELDDALSSLESVSLNGVDNFFQVLRRHVNMLERLVTSGANGRRWNAYAGYNPEWMIKLVDIKCIYFNYCMTDERSNRAKLKASRFPEPTTPAMRLGLVDKVFNAQDILSFSSTLMFIESELRKKSA